jgi:hypothetical protein
MVKIEKVRINFYLEQCYLKVGDGIARIYGLEK